MELEVSRVYGIACSSMFTKQILYTFWTTLVREKTVMLKLFNFLVFLQNKYLYFGATSVKGRKVLIILYNFLVFLQY